MGKTRDLFRKIRDTKGTLLAKMGSIKDRNGIDLMEALCGPELATPLVTYLSRVSIF